MSHTTTLKGVAIRDTAAMRQATDALKKQGIDCDLVENAKPRMFYADQHQNCPFVLKLNAGRYDVGFDKQADGTYAPVFDEWANHISGQIGAACPLPTNAEERGLHHIGKWMQEYTRFATINAAAAQGYIVESAEFDKAGNIQLTLAA